MDNPDFFIASSEGYGLEGPRACKRLKQVRSDSRDDLLLVRIEPPIIDRLYRFREQDIDTLLLAARRHGESLFPIGQWPVFVYVTRLLIKSPEEREHIYRNEYDLIVWAELYPTEKDALSRAV
jgi:hypothetical protein